MINEQHLVDEILRRDFISFLHRCVQTLDPGEQYLDNWHLHAIAYRLEQVRAGEVTRLIVNMPPRHLKSITVSVALPAFLLGHNPRRRIFCISYGMDLAEKHAADFRSIVQSDWYRRAFPQMRIKRVAGSDVFTTLGGYRRTTSIGAALTGMGGDLFIIDDPQKPIDVLTETSRNATNHWFSHTLLSRLDNKATGAIIMVTQRLHLNDFTGYLTENSSDWTVLSLPAIAEVDEEIPIGNGNFHRRRAGEALHPGREPIEALEKHRRESIPEYFAAQYQQTPVPPGGAMIKKEWFRYYDRLPERTYKAKVIQSWDTAAKAGVQNDYSVCTTWLLVDGHYYLMDLIRGRFEYPQLRGTAIAQAQRHKPHVILIEDTSSGTALAQELRKAGHPVVPVKVAQDKVGRLFVQQEKFATGRVLFPKGASFLPELETELLSFPQGKTDDQVDSISQALAHELKRFDYANV